MFYCFECYLDGDEPETLIHDCETWDKMEEFIDVYMSGNYDSGNDSPRCGLQISEGYEDENGCLHETVFDEIYF